jgi:hypothetical protein
VSCFATCRSADASAATTRADLYETLYFQRPIWARHISPQPVMVEPYTWCLTAPTQTRGTGASTIL